MVSSERTSKSLLSVALAGAFTTGVWNVFISAIFPKNRFEKHEKKKEGHGSKRQDMRENQIGHDKTAHHKKDGGYQ
jgi:hypothetical protein